MFLVAAAAAVITLAAITVGTAMDMFDSEGIDYALVDHLNIRNPELTLQR